jgi:hypothetical protein
VTYSASGSSSGSPAPAAYDGAKVEALAEGLIALLPEAKNFRRLKDTEFVTVTLGGSDDAGQPVRFTLKAAKRDIDALSSGKISPEEFRKKVARQTN